ncbi:MAG: hypothetical protein JSW54_00540 [Fidelibacterota bacterium]|nr:MAG: hypothetical protein JSW54_00540 [Candidatus Neomarinimicrobiota bacterium]
MRRMPISLFLSFTMALLLSACAAIQSGGLTDKAEPGAVNYRLIKLHYTNTSGEEGLTSYEYDRNGVQHRATWELLDGNRSSANYHTFDRHGNLVAKYREFSDGITSLLKYEYDDQNHLIGEHFERSDGVTGTVRYEIGDDGKTVRADCKGQNGWFYGIISYEYDESGRKTGGIIEREGKTTGSIRYSYSEQGDLHQEVWDFPGVWSQTFIYEYEQVATPMVYSGASSNVFAANTGEYRVVSEHYDYGGTQGGPSTYEYDDGRLVKKVFVRSDGLQTETTYEYDSAGILLKSYRTYSNGLNAVFTYEFNGNRKLVRRTYERSDGVTGGEEYVYNWKGNLQTAQYDNVDSWLTGTITFQYDDQGELSKGYFKGEDNFDAEITFESDAIGNITKIRWDFSFGSYQVYTFTYEEIGVS